ncbi:MAG TPA: SET domain-containing protein [Urbifossiella sp.]|nr:SET domain-containing protein [Urbifossiella sp.]
MHHFRLKPSAIPGAGVGVFATADIPAGTVLRELFADDDVRFLSWVDFAALEAPAELKENFPVRYDDGCYLPQDFNRMSVGWFLNDSRDPNLGHDPDYVYSALRDIRTGEELLIDYDQL